MRLHPGGGTSVLEERTREMFIHLADRYYLPPLGLLRDLVSSYREFKRALGISGIFLEQAELYKDEIVDALCFLLEVGYAGHQIEFLKKTYFHFIASLFNDPLKQEFCGQVSYHRDKMRNFFGVRPTSFRNTAFIYDDDIGTVIADTGYTAIVCPRHNSATDNREGHPDMLPSVFRANGCNLRVIAINRQLKAQISREAIYESSEPGGCVSPIRSGGHDTVVLGFDLGVIGSRRAGDNNSLQFWRQFLQSFAHHSDISMVTPDELVNRYRDKECPNFNPVGKYGSSDDTHKIVQPYFSNETKYRLFRDIERLGRCARKAGSDLLSERRCLSSLEDIDGVRERQGSDYAFPERDDMSPDMVAENEYISTRRIDELEAKVQRFEILKKSTQKTAVLIITPETSRLPQQMGTLAQFVCGKSGGLGQVVAALCEGLTERGIDCHVATLSLKRRFQRESNVDDWKWHELRHKIDPEKIHLLSSAVYSDLPSSYAGDPRINAAEFQKQIVNYIIRSVRARYGGNLIIHSHDWMAGGVITAYAKTRGCPVLHTVHNSFTAHVPLEMMLGVNIGQLSEHIYFSDEYGRRCVDCQATAIKNASIINFVGKKFLEEIVNDHFSDQYIIPWSVREEVKQKYFYGSAVTIANCPSPAMYPERCPYLARSYGLDDAAFAKKENLVEFQKRTGLVINSDAILLFWPSRLDPSQKGVDLIEDIALKFVIEHGDVQIAIVADGVGGDRTHEEILGKIACVSGGKITYQHFSEELSMLGYAAASDVFGASLYEPCGQIDQIGNIFGATTTNRDTGGYHDKIRELTLKSDGAPRDVGNGFLFRDYDSGGLWYGLEKAVNFHRRPLDVKVPQIKRIMVEARQRYDTRTMIAEYVEVYERLNGGRPLG